MSDETRKVKYSTLKLEEVLIVRTQGPLPGTEILAKALASQTGALVVVLQHGERIEAINEDRMREFGWVRAPK